MEHKFKVGDRVKCIGVHEGRYSAVGQVGTVVGDPSTLTVEFDSYVGGHSAGGEGKRGHCWHFMGNPGALELVKKGRSAKVKPAKFIATYGSKTEIFLDKDELSKWLKEAKVKQSIDLTSVQVFEVKKQYKVNLNIRLSVMR